MEILKIFKQKKTYYYIFAHIPLLVFVFQYFISQDFRLITYDVEPDYIINGLNVLDSGLPIGYHHPGALGYFLTAFLIKISLLLNFNLMQTIILSRSVFILILFFTIFYFNRQSITKIYLYFLFILIIPGFKVFFGLITAEVLVFSLSIFIAHLLSRKELNPLNLGLITALAVSAKLSTLLIFPIIGLYFITKNSVKNLIKALYYFSFSLIIIQLPSLPGFAYTLKDWIYIRPIQVINSIINVGNSYAYYLIVIFAVIAFVVMMYKNHEIFYDFIRSNYEVLVGWYALIICASFIYFSINSFNLCRHCVALIPFCINFIHKEFIKDDKYLIITCNGFILLSLIMNPLQNVNYKFKTEFDQFVDRNKDKIIFANAVSRFNSEYLFKEWSIYKYGNSYDLWPLNWTSHENVKFINTRDQNCKMVPPFAEKTIISRWLLTDYVDYNEYYPHCIDEQINQLIDKKALLTSFKMEVYSDDYNFPTPEDGLAEGLKDLIHSKGYSLYKHEDFKDFIVWGVRKQF